LNIEDLRTALGDYEELLTFEDSDKNIIIGQKGFIVKGKWDAINEQIQKLGGKYQGSSIWFVPKETPQPSQQKKTPLQDDRIYEAIDLLEKALTKLREAGY